MATIFLSSTYLEMRDYRDVARDAVNQYGHRCVRMEDFPAADRAIEDFCRQRVSECDLVILLLGKLYGTAIPGRDISYTEDEFDTAVAVGKPILVFEPTPHAPTDTAAALASSGLDYDVQQRRQSEFAKKILRGRLPRLFTDVADLKFQVGYTLAVQATKPSARYAGERIPYLCNRRLQIDGFGESFRTSLAGQPVVFVVHGHELEQHKQCVQRLICRHITYPKRTATAPLVAPADKGAVVEWPIEKDSEEILFDRLCRRLFLTMNPDGVFQDGLGAAAFCTLVLDTRVSYLRFRHLLRLERWDETAQALCARRYLPFWRDVRQGFDAIGRNQNPPRVLLFFEFKHRLGDDAGRAFGDRLSEFFAAAERATGVTCRVLPQLAPVTQDDLDIWYDSFSTYLLGQFRSEPFSGLFAPPPLHMIDVENRLRQLVGMEDHGQ